MPGSTQGPTQQQNQTQSSQTSPWAPAQPLLQSILGQLGGQSTGPTAGQTGALNLLQQEAGATPNFGGQGTSAINNLFSSSTAPQTGLLSNAYGNLQNTLSPYTSAGYTNPMTTPGFGDALKTTNQDIINQINGQFAAAGRDLSPANSQALARGLSQGEGQLISNQYNANVGQQQNAANTLYGAGSNTATTGAQLNQIPLANQLQAIQGAGSIPGLLTQPGATQLGVANTAYGLPLSNIQALEGLTTPIAGLGSQSSGNSQTTTTSQQPLLPTILGGISGAAGLLGAFSDRRAKENIKRIGTLFDGLPVYVFNYKADETKCPQIGLMAQDVEREIPEAVHEIGGLKFVNYEVATSRAAHQAAA